MAKNYTITFKSLRAGTVYTVNIGGGTGTPVALKGGAQPFATQEDDSEDMFQPIRTQTGYIRIVDDGLAADGATAFDWKDLIPATDTSRPVTVTTTSGGTTTVHWQGFMQARTFNGTLYGNPQEREFPVQCLLSVLETTNVNGSNRELKNFAYVIKQAFDSISGLTINNYIFQGGSYALSWLKKKVDWQNLTTDDDGQISGRFDNQRVLEDVCTFWGWTCRTHGQDIIFECVDDTTVPGVLTLTSTQMGQLAGGSSVGTIGNAFLTEKTPSGSIFASADNDETQVRGVEKATVQTDCNAADETLIEAFPSSVENIMANTGEPYYDQGAYYSADLTSFNSSFLTGYCRSSYASFNVRREPSTDSRNISVSDVIRIYKSYAGSSHYHAQLTTVFQHTFPGNQGDRFGVRPIGLALHATIYSNAQKYENYEPRSGVGNKTMYMRLGIGTSRSNAKWFNGDSWTSTEATFKATLGNRTDELFAVGTIRNAATIPLPTDNILHGLIFVEFLGSDDMPMSGSERKFDLADFSLTYVTTNADQTVLGETTKDSSMTYKAVNGSKMVGEWGADLVYASMNNLARGYGLVINEDYTFVTLVDYGQSLNAHPEQHLADRVVAFWSHSRRRLDVDLLSNAAIDGQGGTVADLSPQHKVTMADMTSYPISISRNWRDDIVRLTLIQL